MRNVVVLKVVNVVLILIINLQFNDSKISIIATTKEIAGDWWWWEVMMQGDL